MKSSVVNASGSRPRAGLLGRAAKGVATAGGLGFSPVAPGTVGSLAGWALYSCGPRTQEFRSVLLAFLVVLGLWSGGYSRELFGREDARPIVIDEVAGMYLALCVSDARTGIAGFVCFLLFRALDVFKPFGIRALERLPGGAGIMADDLAAGVIGAVFIRGLARFAAWRW